MVKQKRNGPWAEPRAVVPGAAEDQDGAPVNTDSTEQAASGYTKQQFLDSVKYATKKDLLNALLDDDQTYTAEQVDQQLDEFLKKEAE